MGRAIAELKGMLHGPDASGQPHIVPRAANNSDSAPDGRHHNRAHGLEPDQGNEGNPLLNYLESAPPFLSSAPTKSHSMGEVSLGDQNHNGTNAKLPPSIFERTSNLNPRHLLKRVKETKAFLITDYIVTFINEDETEEDKPREEKTQTRAKRVNLDTVTPTQWSAANSRIMYELMRSGELRDLKQVTEYLDYSCLVMDYAQLYEWQSILKFDDQFRRAQSISKFSWSSEPSHSLVMHLRALPPRPGKKTARPKPKEQGQEFCRSFNHTGSCKFGPTCRHKHLCMVPGCNKNHPLVQHPTTGND